jgi:hypothetical protein
MSITKAKAILATLLVTAALHADDRFALPHPRKAVAPDEGGHWITLNVNSWPQNANARRQIRTVLRCTWPKKTLLNNLSESSGQ